MNYAYFIKNLPSDLIPLINSFVDPKTDYYLTILKERVMKFSGGGLYRINMKGVQINHSYFSRYEGLETAERIDTLDFNNIQKMELIIGLKNQIKRFFKPMKRKYIHCQIISYYLKKNGLKDTVSNGDIILALLLLGVKYKSLNTNELVYFYCQYN